jgi:DnaK suppressor protein
MSDSLQACARQLTLELEELALALARAADDAGTVTLEQTSVGRLSRMDALQQQAMAQERRQRLLPRQRQLLAARDRLADGRYGRCCACDADIEPQRLARDPAVVFCHGCQSERQASS